MNQNNAIGFFDSGIGGISVLADAIRALPYENFIYLGDHKNAPLGTKTDMEVRSLTREAVDLLRREGIKALVIACNTATAAAVADLRQTYAFPIIGLEPALKLAEMHRHKGIILVMATPLTLSSNKYALLYQQFGRHAISLPCPGLMDFVEREDFDSPALHQYLQDLFAPFDEQVIDSVVLGCTHYLFLKDAIKKSLPDGIRLVDSNQGVVQQLIRRLRAENLISSLRQQGQVRLISTGGSQKEDQMHRMLELFLKSSQSC